MASPAQRAIVILIDMAEQGEINPWDVKVIEVIDRFLAELNLDNLVTAVQPSHLQGNSYETNLSESGQAFLYASMLVLLKADTLARMESEQEQALHEDALIEPPDNVIPLPLNLEQRIRRRAVAQPPQQRPVTLPELIEQLELMAAAMESRPLRPKKRHPKPQSELQTSTAIDQLSQQENPAELAAAIGEFVLENWLLLTQGQDFLVFDALVDAWSKHTRNVAVPTICDRVSVFWSLLLLSAQSKVELRQPELYGSLEIRLVSSVPETSDFPAESPSLSAISS